MKPSPSDRIHKHFGFTSTSCPTAEGFKFLFSCNDLTFYSFKLTGRINCGTKFRRQPLVETRHHYIFEGDICREVSSLKLRSWGSQSLKYFTRITACSIISKFNQIKDVLSNFCWLGAIHLPARAPSVAITERSFSEYPLAPRR